jgi:hypothetical protein
MKDKTAMQQMLGWVRKTLPMDLDTPRMIEAKIESLLKVEKEQIKNAWLDGFKSSAEGWNGEMLPYYKDGEQRIAEHKEEYYNETYANDTTKGLPEEDSKRRAWHY